MLVDNLAHDTVNLGPSNPFFGSILASHWNGHLVSFGLIGVSF
jgi:hypothetical protein